MENVTRYHQYFCSQTVIRLVPLKQSTHFLKVIEFQNFSIFLKQISRYFYIIFKAISKLFWICKVSFEQKNVLPSQLHSKLKKTFLSSLFQSFFQSSIIQIWGSLSVHTVFPGFVQFFQKIPGFFKVYHHFSRFSRLSKLSGNPCPLIEFISISKTRMHSSRMRTTRFSGHLGGGGVCLGVSARSAWHSLLWLVHMPLFKKCNFQATTFLCVLNYTVLKYLPNTGLHRYLNHIHRSLQGRQQQQLLQEVSITVEKPV